MMVLVRALGWLLLAMALAILVYGGLTWWSEGAFGMVPLGEVWSRLDPGALDFLQGTSPLRSNLAWLLDAPAVLVFAVLGLLGLWLGRRRSAAQDTGFVLGGRPRRRRRGRSELS
jgi:hypothetical protein